VSKRARRIEISKSDRRKIRETIDALPPLSEEEIDALCETIRIVRAHWEREDETRTTS
jgi:hypothetical protein